MFSPLKTLFLSGSFADLNITFRSLNFYPIEGMSFKRIDNGRKKGPLFICRGIAIKINMIQYAMWIPGWVGMAGSKFGYSILSHKALESIENMCHSRSNRQRVPFIFWNTKKWKAMEVNKSHGKNNNNQPS